MIFLIAFSNTFSMAGTFSQLYVQVVFAVKDRQPLIENSWKEELHKYMAGIITGKNQKSLIVNGMPDHIHALVGLRPNLTVSDLVRDLKNNSSSFINDRKFLRGKFSWQEGYAAFSYGQSQIKSVYEYILNQERHHKKRTFKEEYIALMQQFQIEFNEKYVFD